MATVMGSSPFRVGPTLGRHSRGSRPVGCSLQFRSPAGSSPSANFRFRNEAKLTPRGGWHSPDSNRGWFLPDNGGANAGGRFGGTGERSISPWAVGNMCDRSWGRGRFRLWRRRRAHETLDRPNDGDALDQFFAFANNTVDSVGFQMVTWSNSVWSRSSKVFLVYMHLTMSSHRSVVPHSGTLVQSSPKVASRSG